MSTARPNLMSKLCGLFPHINIPFLDQENMQEYIDVKWPVTQKLVKELPKPAPYQIGQTISNMKSIVDSQELQIQRSMMEEEELPTKPDGEGY